MVVGGGGPWLGKKEQNKTFLPSIWKVFYYFCVCVCHCLLAGGGNLCILWWRMLMATMTIFSPLSLSDVSILHEHHKMEMIRGGEEAVSPCSCVVSGDLFQSRKEVSAFQKFITLKIVSSNVSSIFSNVFVLFSLFLKNNF